MGFDPHRVMHLGYYARRLGRVVDPEGIEVRGEPVHGRPAFRGAFETFRERYPEVRILEGRAACSGCSGELIGALSYIRMAGHADRLQGLTILMGCPVEDPGAAGGGGRKSVASGTDHGPTLRLGTCCRETAPPAGLRCALASGCPPKDRAIIDSLAGLCGFDGNAVLELRDAERRRLWESTAALLEH